MNTVHFLLTYIRTTCTLSLWYIIMRYHFFWHSFLKREVAFVQRALIEHFKGESMPKRQIGIVLIKNVKS